MGMGHLWLGHLWLKWVGQLLYFERYAQKRKKHQSYSKVSYCSGGDMLKFTPHVERKKIIVMNE